MTCMGPGWLQKELREQRNGPKKRKVTKSSGRGSPLYIAWPGGTRTMQLLFAAFFAAICSTPDVQQQLANCPAPYCINYKKRPGPGFARFFLQYSTFQVLVPGQPQWKDRPVLCSCTPVIADVRNT